jgi:transcriptional regulator with XRE-family HTH domain
MVDKKQKKKHVGRGHPKVSDEDLEKAIEQMDNEGLSQKQVAKKLGIAEASLSTRLKRRRGWADTPDGVVKKLEDIERRLAVVETIFKRYTLVPVHTVKIDKRSRK